MKILLTGCSGQLGQALQAVLASDELICADSKLLDITNESAVTASIQLIKPQLVINAAAYTRVDDAETDQEKAWLVNATGPEYLAKASHAINVPIVQISTDYVFAGTGDKPWVESDETHPLSVYGKSKLAGEQAVMRYNPAHFIVRTAWLYHYSGENFLRTMYRLSERDEIKVVDDQRGSPTNADDLADALLQLISTQAYGIHHLANTGTASWYELTCEFYRQLYIATHVTPVTTEEFPRPAPRPANSVLATERWSAIQMPDWQTGLARLVEQIRQSGWSD